jgi:hypothetical protein
VYHTSGKNIQIFTKPNFYFFSDLLYNKHMGILDNLENSNLDWDKELNFESKPIQVTDAMGREIFWEDLGRPTQQ